MSDVVIGDGISRDYVKGSNGLPSLLMVTGRMHVAVTSQTIDVLLPASDLKLTALQAAQLAQMLEDAVTFHESEGAA